MTVLVVLVVVAGVVAVLAALGRAASSDRADQERQGLFGARQARIRRAVDDARSSMAAADPVARLRSVSASLSTLAFSGARLVTVGPLLDGWWQLAFADGTTLFVLPSDARLKRLRPGRTPTVVQTWSADDHGVELVLSAAGVGPHPLPCRDLVVVPPSAR